MWVRRSRSNIYASGINPKQEKSSGTQMGVPARRPVLFHRFGQIRAVQRELINEVLFLKFYFYSFLFSCFLNPKV